MNSEILNNDKPCTNTEVIDPYEYGYDTVDVHCCFGGSAKIW